MFEEFDEFDFDVDGVTIHGTKGGSGPPLLLLHGYPETHKMWHKIAPQLAESYTIVASDLRGYGDSSKPDGGDGHANYAFRKMASDQLAVMRKLGFETFRLAGHDRGARTAHRLALDHPDAVENLILMDIVPTLTLYETADQRMATGYYHWYFLIQPYDFPERLIGADPEYYLRRTLENWSDVSPFSEETMAEYIRCFNKPETIHASCEDYRAAASVDLDNDRSDHNSGRKIKCPTLILWGLKSLIGRTYDMIEVWHDKTEIIPAGRGLPCGHFLPEEAPHETYSAIMEFLSGEFLR